MAETAICLPSIQSLLFITESQSAGAAICSPKTYFPDSFDMENIIWHSSSQRYPNRSHWVEFLPQKYIDLSGFCLSPFVLSFLPAGNKDMMAGPPEVISGAGNKDLRMGRNSQRSLVIWRSRSTSSELPKIPCYVTGKIKLWSSLSHCHWVFDLYKAELNY